MTETAFDRLPPHDIEAEQCALGAAMLSPDAASILVEELREDDFLRPAHQTIHTAIVTVLENNGQVNAVTVRTELERRRLEMEQGNASRESLPDGVYLHSLIERVPIVGSMGFYVKRLRALRNLRALVYAGPRIAQIGWGNAAEDVDHALEMANKVLDEATHVATKSTAASVADLITPFLEQLESGEKRSGLSTGWVDVDSLLSGLRPGQLITIGARPGMGKTAAMANLAHHVGVKLRLPVFVGTLEMSTEEFMGRIVAHDAKVDLKRLLEPELLTDDDWDRLRRSHSRLAEAGTLVIDDEPGMGVGHVRGALRSMRRSGRPAALAVIDYLQLMQSPARVESRQVEVSQFSRSLKLMAKEFALPVVVGSQLNRAVEQRADKKPTMADLRESGSLEQDSDVVALLYRPDAYDPESPRAGEIDLIVDKNRSGPKGTITLAFQGRYSRVADMAKAEWSPTGGLS
ncbi:MAG: Replicative helicase [Streptosporangiaceae bacterium]|nr:Replicative helicase [Streptosporangiaceae bacterium]